MSSPSTALTSSPLWREYVTLTKPGIIRSNLFTAFGGFWLAAQADVLAHWSLLGWMLLATALVMASACVFNNFFDRDRDHLMERTQQRPLVTGRISPTNVLLFACLLGVAGVAIFFLTMPWLAGVWALIGMFVYIVVYTLWLKRSSTHNTLIGGISGAVPPVIGYVALSGQMDIAAWALFFILFIWQPPHFFALAIRRVEEYRAANFPMLPVVKGIPVTKVQMLIYILLMFPSVISLYAFGYAGWLYLTGALLLTVGWLWFAVRGFSTKDDTIWARNTFLYSIAYLILLFIFMMADTALIA